MSGFDTGTALDERMNAAQPAFRFRLRVMEADHFESEFYELGNVTTDGTDPRTVFNDVTDIGTNPTADIEYILDLLDHTGAIIDNKMIAAGTVETLLGEPVADLHAAAVDGTPLTPSPA